MIVIVKTLAGQCFNSCGLAGAQVITFIAALGGGPSHDLFQLRIAVFGKINLKN